VHLNYLAWTHLTCLHQYQQGLTFADEALELARSVHDTVQEAWALTYRGSALRRLLRHQEAIGAYRQASASFATLGTPTGQVGRLVADRFAGACLRESGLVQEALTTHQRTQADTLRGSVPPLSYATQLMAGFITHEVGLDQAALGHWQEAEHSYRQALTHFEAAGRADSSSQTLAELGTALVELGRADEARAVLGEVLAGSSDKDTLLRVTEQLDALERPRQEPVTPR